jgi:hypothetical protein
MISMRKRRQGPFMEDMKMNREAIAFLIALWLVVVGLPDVVGLAEEPCQEASAPARVTKGSNEVKVPASAGDAWLTMDSEGSLKELFSRRKLPAGVKGLSLNGRALKDSQIGRLPGLSDLKFLDLSNTPISDEGLAHLAACRRLERLDLSNTPVTGSGLNVVESLGTLKCLYLQGAKIDDQGWRHLRSASLETLDISGSRVTDNGLANLTGLPKLRELYLDGTGAAWKAMIALESCPQVRVLGLAGTQLQDDGIEHLVEGQCGSEGPQHGELVALDLAGTRITSEGIRLLPKLTKLRYLSTRPRTTPCFA